MKRFLSVVLAITMLFAITSVDLTASAMVSTDILYGDADGNGIVNVADATLVLEVAAGLKSITDENNFKCADVNNDGYITVFDARQILRACANLVTLTPEGAEEFANIDGRFWVDESLIEAGININSPEVAVAVFNTVLNRVKTEYPGFKKSEAVNVSGFKLQDITFEGISFGNSTESVTKLIEEMLVSESEPDEVQTIIKGENSYNAMSVETKDYVSKLSAKDIYGAKVSYNGVDEITISIALPNCEIDNLSQTAYADVFNTKILAEKTNSTIESVFSATSMEDAKRKLCKDAVLTLVFDTETSNVISYTTTYITDMYLLKSSFTVSSLLSAELHGVEYMTKVTVTYNDFQW